MAAASAKIAASINELALPTKPDQSSEGRRASEVWLTPNTLNPTPYTLHPEPYTLHPTPYTLHPSPFTLHPPLGETELLGVARTCTPASEQGQNALYNALTSQWRPSESDGLQYKSRG